MVTVGQIVKGAEFAAPNGDFYKINKVAGHVAYVNMRGAHGHGWDGGMLISELLRWLNKRNDRR